MANAAIDTKFSEEEPPESLFMKELKRRGMTPTSLLEDYKQGNSGVDEEVVVNEQDRGLPRRNVVSTDVERSLENQREQSMALNSEGLEIDSLLTFIRIGFDDLVCTVLQYFGSTFVHDTSKMSLSPPQYVDPYALLEDERISQIALQLK
ncbi:uncharacterized protein LOC107636294 [Arachis ipaensis]|uniref:uncharacterized protein LOC107636294 n=1 Tax=Arachis ipaensis TaxID=130454 RepID=UPI000A2B1B14|nr:uncharacterized protein LOC107636294 [Arachis ipaensis]XP_025647484.1 uncharacterized protein LOC112742463 [Arachis hypogaea]